MLTEELLEVEDVELLKHCAPGQGVRLFSDDKHQPLPLPDSQCLLLRHAQFLSPVSAYRTSFAGAFEALWPLRGRCVLPGAGRLGVKLDVWCIDWLIAGYHPQKAGWFYIPIDGTRDIKPLFYAEHALQLGRHLFVRGVGPNKPRPLGSNR